MLFMVSPSPMCSLGKVMMTESGVNTGFGGSADTRTKQSEGLKHDLLNSLLYGMLGDATTNTRQTVFLPPDHKERMSMPESWARAAMLVRINSLAHGASGVLLSTVHGVIRLLNENVTPRIPLHGSISASGDLSPLAYIAGLLEGQPTVTAWVGKQTSGQRRLENGKDALSKQGIAPVILDPREALALVNGTSMSAGLAALVMYEAIHLAGLSQVLTAMSVEALRGTDESFDPLLAQVRPHWGQAESAQNIRGFLRGSKLVYRDHGFNETSLRQDRYSIRTASQWLGPMLEDLTLAHRQVTTELNSATDNPLIDIRNQKTIHGGNFQAQSITSAMEKVRQAAQLMGRMLFVQCTELINPATSRGLPPNLVFTEPSESFVFKSTDILIASLLSELGYLATPITPHVQTAEMGNQALNSLALISARYTMDSLNILKQMVAAHLIAVCQALDLRLFQSSFLTTLHPEMCDGIARCLESHLIDTTALPILLEDCWKAFLNHLERTTSLDSTVRIPGAADHLQSLIMPHLTPSKDSFDALSICTKRLGDTALKLYLAARDRYLRAPDAKYSLGTAGKRFYGYLRQELKVPVIGPETLGVHNRKDANDEVITIGDLNDRVRGAMTENGLYKLLALCIDEVGQTKSLALKRTGKL